MTVTAIENKAIGGDPKCLVIGAGPMGQAHLRTLAAMIPGRYAAVANSDRNKGAALALGAHFYSCSLAAALAEFTPTHAIVASPVDLLAEHTEALLQARISAILVEKPAAMTLGAVDRLIALARETGAEIFVAYNRRFYAAIRTARAMMEDNGETIASVFFEFTEWSHVIETLKNQSAATKAHWLLANSMHVIDVALHLVGLPDMDKTRFITTGSLDWHPSACVFAGAGLTCKSVPFSYAANWNAPGRWSAEWLTPSTRYIFRPLEKLHVVRRGTVAVDEVPLLDELDNQFKPGVFLQNKAFLTGERKEWLVPLSEARALIALAQAMASYDRD